MRSYVSRTAPGYFAIDEGMNRPGSRRWVRLKALVAGKSGNGDGKFLAEVAVCVGCRAHTERKRGHTQVVNPEISPLEQKVSEVPAVNRSG
jgi:hypothetical protein